jgi:uncharacterized protein (DUF1330 family)
MSYLIGQITIHDSETYQKYVEGNREIFKRYNAETILVDENPTFLEGSWEHGHIVVIRFPSEAEAIRFYNSPEYQEHAQIRWKSSDSTIILAREGIHHHIT